MDKVLVYRTTVEASKLLNDSQFREFYDKYFDYVLNGTPFETNDSIIQMLFISLKKNIDNASERYKNCVENGKKGGAPNTIEEPKIYCDNIEQIKASYKYYYRLTNYLQENNYTYKEEFYKNVIYVTIPEVRMVVIVRGNDKISKSNNNYVLKHFIPKKYMPRCYDDNSLKLTQFKSIVKRKRQVGRKKDRIENIPQPKIIEKKHKNTYEFADEMRDNPTKAEREFANVLNNNGILYEQQVVVKSKDNNKKYIADFLVGNIVVEVDGGYHFTSEQKIADENRTKDLVDLGFSVLRIKNEDVLKHTEKLDNLVNSLIAV